MAGTRRPARGEGLARFLPWHFGLAVYIAPDMTSVQTVTLSRDTEAVQIPAGHVVTLPAGQKPAPGQVAACVIRITLP